MISKLQPSECSMLQPAPQAVRAIADDSRGRQFMRHEQLTCKDKDICRAALISVLHMLLAAEMMINVRLR